MQELDGRIAVVTGAGSGIGAAAARRLCAEGMRVVVADIAGDAAEAVATGLRSEGGDAVATTVDVGRPDQVRALADVARSFGGCHLVCANVGVNRIARHDRLDERDWRWLLDVNVLGTVATVNALLPVVRESGGGHIVVTSSTNALLPAPSLAAYSASKFAVTGYAETLRMELADEGIGVTIMFPNPVATNHLQSSDAARPADAGPPPELEADDLVALSAGMQVGPDDMVSPDHAVRNLPAAIRENRPYLVTHPAIQGLIRDRFAALLDAVDRAGE